MHRLASIFATCALLCCAVAACEVDNVEFGVPGGLQLVPNNVDSCALPAGIDLTCAGASPDWATEVYPLFDSVKYGCTNENCHGDPARLAGLYMPQNDNVTGYNNMLDYKALDGSGKKYIDPEKGGYLLCNLNPDPAETVGSLMPLGLSPITGDDLKLIGQWYACGQLLEGDGGGVGGGGNGGAGGAPGAGGN